MEQAYDPALSCGEAESRFADVRAARERRRALREGVYDEPVLPRSYSGDAYESGEVYEKPKGALLRVLLTQTIVLALLLGGLFITQKAAPNTYDALHAAYAHVMKTDLSAKEVWLRVRDAFSQLRDEIYVVAPPAQTEAAAEDTTEGAAATEENTETQSIDASLLGQGGQDVALAFAERSCSLVPLITTVAPAPPLQQGRITSAFGLRTHPVSGLRSVHTGLDIGADMGEPIAAAFFGTVTKTVLDDPGYGNYLIMDHGGGLQTMYAHCSELLAEEGMVLRAGETIALVGSTGVSTGPHLHFELRLHGLRCDPEPLLAGYY